MNDFFNPEPLTKSELIFIQTTSFYENKENCLHFTPETEIANFEYGEENYSYCRCPAPHSKKIVSFNFSS